MASKSRKTNPAKDAVSVLSDRDLTTLRMYLQKRALAAEAKAQADGWAEDVLKIVKEHGPLMLGTQRVRVKKRKGWGLEAQIKEARKQAERSGLATAIPHRQEEPQITKT